MPTGLTAQLSALAAALAASRARPTEPLVARFGAPSTRFYTNLAAWVAGRQLEPRPRAWRGDLLSRCRGGLAGVLMVAALLGWGCTETETGVDASQLAEAGGVDGDDLGEPIDTPFANSDTSADATSGTGSDGLVLPDLQGDGAPVGGCPGAAGCPCTKTTDCSSGFCLDTPNGQQCAKKCDDGTCPTDFKCATVPLTGGDVTNICVPAHGSLCNPCISNSQCQGPGNGGARCVSFGNGGAFCGEACSATADCVVGYECLESKDLVGNSSKQCVVKNGGACTCSAAAMKNELFTACYKDTGTAKCTGKRICLSATAPGAPSGGGLSNCLADEPEAEKCDGKDNDCDGQTDESACDDGTVCTDDNCDPKAGCSHTNNSGFCDADGSVCTKDDACSNGKCLTGKPVSCDDNNPCTTDSCDAKLSCKYANADSLGCNFDDNPCTVGDACKEGKCAAGATKACATDEPCILGKCNLLGDGKCEYKNKDGQPCDDASPCTSVDTCVADVCVGKATDCNDNNGCTIDACDKKTGCTHADAAGSCDDGDKCTTKDACVGGKCDGQTVDPSKACNDNNACTIDACNPALGCVNKPAVGLGCDDANACSVGDKCDGTGTCLSGTNTCACDNDAQCAAKDDGNTCNGTLFCDKSGPLSQCKVKLGTVVTCDTSSDNPCKKTDCEPVTGKCTPKLQPDGLPCPADDNVCTVDDSCKAGACLVGKILNCDDKNTCTADICDAKLGCKHLISGGPCNADGDACTVDDGCKDGKCEVGAKKVCDDAESCTQDSCDGKSGNCVFKQLEDQACTDGNECTVGDKCGTDKAGKYTCVAGSGPNCDDGNPCTADTCDGKAGCKNTIDPSAQAICYSGDPATKGKGICKAGLQNCDALGKLGPCLNQVLPEAKDTCDGMDNDCNGITDPGCSPTGWSARFATADVGGKGPNLTLRAVAGASNTAGSVADSKYTLKWGFLAWIKGWLGK
ncbi:MAG: hypothetical protein EXR77_05140 [Myxococcales bacterium]|nr:hypothetical protein [Myxococcales bacterium]